MAEEQNSGNFRERLKNRYRLVILDDADLSELRSYRLTGLNIYVLISSFILLITLLLGSLLIFTPLKRWVPGYGDVQSNYEFIELQKKVVDLEEAFGAQETYIDGMKEMISGGEIPQKSLATNEVNLDNVQSIASPIVHEDRAQHLFFSPPLRGKISEPFMSDKDHFGLDITAPKGSAVSAISDGVVISAEWNIETGHAITVQHEMDIISVYKHNDKLLKKIGNKVDEGEAIAILGNTGMLSTGPHLHFELWSNGKPLNPSDYISFN